MKKFAPLFSVTAVIACLTTARAAIITVNTEDNTDFSAGKTNLVTAIKSLNDGDTIAFNIPGTAGRGIISGPRTHKVDFTMTKIIRFSESLKLQLRGEAFNIFNWTNFRSFTSTNVTSSAFGQIGAVRDPRTIQLSAKFYF